VPFLIGLRGRRRFALAVTRAVAEMRGSDRSQAKAALLRHVVAGLPVDTFRAQAQAYGRSLSTKLRPDTVARIEEHQRLDHTVVIVSASLRAFLEPVAEGLGADGLVCTELEVGADGVLTGELVGANVRGEEKPRRLREHLGAEPAELWAYGNSRGDRPLLAMADHPIWVRPGRPLAPISR
jgi:phosphatidylglycerophosphatase C